jgi:GcrA cell cycle regulator
MDSRFTPWSQQLIDQVKQYWKDGLTATEIGERVQKTRNAILGKLHRMGMAVPGKKLPRRNPNRPAKMHADKPKEPKAPSAPTGRRAKGAGSATPLAAPPPPPLLPLKPSRNGWKGVVAAIDDLQADDCRWPLPDGPIPTTGFCGSPVAPGTQPYCAFHQHVSAHGFPK